MIDLGAGIAIGAISISLAAVVITAIKVKPQKGETCPLHSGIVSTLAFVTDQLEKIESNLTTSINTIHQDIKSILLKMGD